MAKRRLLAVEGDQRFIRRDEKGRFTTEQVDVGRSLAQDLSVKPKRSLKPARATAAIGA